MKIEGKSSQGEPAHPLKSPNLSSPPNGEKKTLGKVFEESVGSKEPSLNCTIRGHVEAGLENVYNGTVEETPSSLALETLLGKDPSVNAWDYFWTGYADHVGKCVTQKEKGN